MSTNAFHRRLLRAGLVSAALILFAALTLFLARLGDAFGQDFGTLLRPAINVYYPVCLLGGLVWWALGEGAVPHGRGDRRTGFRWAAGAVVLVSIFNVVTVFVPPAHAFFGQFELLVSILGVLIYAFLLALLMVSIRTSMAFVALAASMGLAIAAFFLDRPLSRFVFDLSEILFSATSVLLLSASLRTLNRDGGSRPPSSPPATDPTLEHQDSKEE